MELLIAIVILTLILILFIRFIYLYGFSYKHENIPANENQIKVGCVGDSITYGFGLKNWPKNNYPVQLQNLLGDSYNVANFGISGCAISKKADLPYVKSEIYIDSLEYQADILVFMMGSNDSKPFNWISREHFKKSYLDLLETYTKDKTLKVYLCTVSKAFFPKGKTKGMTSYGIKPLIIEEIVEIIKEIANEKNYPLIDINKLTSDNYSWFKKDKVHPNVDGAKAIALEVYKNISSNK